MGGEGLMLRCPGSKYERRRSKNLLKVKTFYDEALGGFGVVCWCFFFWGGKTLGGSFWVENVKT